MNRFNQIFDWIARCFRWVGFLLIYLVDSALLTFATMQVNHPTVVNRSIGLMLIYSAFVLAFITWRYQKQLQSNNPRHFGRTKLTGARFGQLMAFFFLMYGIQMVWSLLISAHILGTPANQTAVNSQTVQLPFWNLAYSILFAPVIEELIFRGIFLNYFFAAKFSRHECLGRSVLWHDLRLHACYQSVYHVDHVFITRLHLRLGLSSFPGYSIQHNLTFYE